MNKNQREILVSCLTQVFGRVEDEFVESVIPLLRWVELAGGETLFRQGDVDDGVYFVLSGRLRTTVSDEGGQRPIGEVTRGETVGEMAVLTGEPRSATVTALRDTVLAHADNQAFDQLWRNHPEIPLHMARVVIERLKRSTGRRRLARSTALCLLPVTAGVDVRGIAERLQGLLDRWGVTAMETSDTIDQRFGPGTSATGRNDEDLHHKVSLWLDDVEFWNDYLLLVADDGDTEWTRRCLRHADEILLLARADAPVALHPIEERHCAGEGRITGARQTLVLLHEEAVTRPRGTSA